MGLLYENSATAFIIITLILGGGAAWLTGRAIARSWEPMWKAVAYMLPLALAARFLHYALGSGVPMIHFFVWSEQTLVWLYYYLVNAGILAVIAALAYRVTRSWQMEAQYPWLYRRTSPVSWTDVGDQAG